MQYAFRDSGLVATTLGFNLIGVAGGLLEAAMGLEFDCLIIRGMIDCCAANGKE